MFGLSRTGFFLMGKANLCSFGVRAEKFFTIVVLSTQ